VRESKRVLFPRPLQTRRQTRKSAAEEVCHTCYSCYISRNDKHVSGRLVTVDAFVERTVPWSGTVGGSSATCSAYRQERLGRVEEQQSGIYTITIDLDSVALNYLWPVDYQSRLGDLVSVSQRLSCISGSLAIISNAPAQVSLMALCLAGGLWKKAMITAVGGSEELVMQVIPPQTVHSE